MPAPAGARGSQATAKVPPARRSARTLDWRRSGEAGQVLPALQLADHLKPGHGEKYQEHGRPDSGPCGPVAPAAELPAGGAGRVGITRLPPRRGRPEHSVQRRSSAAAPAGPAAGSAEVLPKSSRTVPPRAPAAAARDR
jgi:hypothetical protein